MTFYKCVFPTAFVKKVLIKKKLMAEKKENLKVQCSGQHFLVSLTKTSHCLVLKGQQRRYLSLSNLNCKVLFLFSPQTKTMLHANGSVQCNKTAFQSI